MLFSFYVADYGTEKLILKKQKQDCSTVRHTLLNYTNKSFKKLNAFSFYLHAPCESVVHIIVRTQKLYLSRLPVVEGGALWMLNAFFSIKKTRLFISYKDTYKKIERIA